jgi:hypothetical protein
MKKAAAIEDRIPDHSVLCRARNERFRESDALRRVRWEDPHYRRRGALIPSPMATPLLFSKMEP